MTTFGSVCSGIEAATVAWAPLGWKTAWVSEIDRFPCALLAHYYPDVPNLGDMTALPERVRAGEVEDVDVFTGGTPCQAFSVAGLRRSLEDARGNLSLTFVEIADANDDVRRAAGREPGIVVWENVPGVLSTADNAFGCFLGALAGSGDTILPPASAPGVYERWPDAGVVLGPRRTVAWRVFDAQFFGLAQRRRRVFVVASARAGFDPGAVLLEFGGVRRDSAPSRETREDPAACVGGGPDGGRLAGTVSAKWAKGSGGPAGDECYNMVAEVAPTPRAMGHAGSHANGGGQVAVAYSPDVAATMVARSSRGGGQTNSPGHNADAELVAVAYAGGGEVADPLVAKEGETYTHEGATFRLRNCVGQMPVGYDMQNDALNGDVASTLQAEAQRTGNRGAGVLQGMAVRRLTPRECERLQGFPDDYTRIPYRGKPAERCPDGPRYKAIGNSWAVPNVRRIGERIDAALRGEL